MAGIIAGRATRPSPAATTANSQRLPRRRARRPRSSASRSADAHGGHRRLAGDRGDRLGRAAPQRPRPQHPRAQPLVRHRLDAVLRLDPLAYAAEQAWKAGIVVVAAAGNDGFMHQGTLTNPAYDPFVMAVGAADPNGTLDLADDQVPSFSSSGAPAAGRKSRDPDLVAPGSHVVSLRAPGRTSTRPTAAAAPSPARSSAAVAPRRRPRSCRVRRRSCSSSGRASRPTS